MLSILKQIPFFASLDNETHQAIIKNIQMQYYPQGYTLFNEGDEADNMYIIKRGKVGIYIERSQKEPVAELHTNDFFGEMALVSNNKRNATAKTLAESEVFVLHKGVFKELMRLNPEIATKISQEIISRINENEATLPAEKNQNTNSIFS